jgi:hypothetical protein
MNHPNVRKRIFVATGGEAAQALLESCGFQLLLQVNDDGDAVLWNFSKTTSGMAVTHHG